MTTDDQLPDPQKAIVVLSDCHLSAGRFYNGRLNPHEDFVFDHEMCDLIDFFSSDKYGDGTEVDLILAGDYLDYLNIPIEGEFTDAITEAIALEKTEIIFSGHKEVMGALRRFAAKPGKRLIYLIGNHDAELFFPSVQEKIVRRWDPNGEFPSASVKVIADEDRIFYEEGVEVRHGNQFEPSNTLEMNDPFEQSYRGDKLLKLPWGSIYVLKIINRLKWDRPYVDKIRPVKLFVMVGLFIDPLFTIKFSFLSGYYFLRARVLSGKLFKIRFNDLLEFIKQETKFFQDLEGSAKELLDNSPRTHTVIFGHTHRPMHKIYPSGKQYLNTGTWTRMIQLDFQGMGNVFRRTFALVHIKDGKTHSELRQWEGNQSPHKAFYD